MVYEYLLLKACIITEQIVENQGRIFILWKNELRKCSEIQELPGNVPVKRGTLFQLPFCNLLLCHRKVIKIWSFRFLFFYLLQVLASKPFRILAVYIHALNLCPMLEFHFFWIVTGSGTRWCDFWAWESSCKSAAVFWAVLYLEGNCERNGETGFATDFTLAHMYLYIILILFWRSRLAIFFTVDLYHYSSWAF